MTGKPAVHRTRHLRTTALTLLALLIAGAFSPGAGSGLAPRHVPAKPAAAALWPGLRDDLIIVKFVEGSEVRLREERLVARADHDVTRANEILIDRSDLAISRLFSRSEESLELDRLDAEQRSGKEMADLNNYYRVTLAYPGTVAAESLLDELNALEVVEIAYAEPIPAVALMDAAEAGWRRPTRQRIFAAAETGTGPESAVTPDFTGLQGYLGPAPDGVDAFDAWTHAGGRGETVKVIDVELGWNFDHEDMKPPFFQGGEITYSDHGIAVVGEIMAQDNGFGVTGIANQVEIGSYSVFGIPTADVFDQAASLLDPGDIYVIELHCPGPDGPFIALEWWQANFDAIAMHSARGVICCAAAGNGSADFDHPRYQGRFDRNVRDSGAIIVGATDGSNLNPAWFTNHGSRVDLAGWGFDVTTTGYGDLQGGPVNQWYTAGFSGTSSATPIVTGTLAAMQGAWKAQSGGVPLSGQTIAQVLKETGTPTTGPELIGPRPNLALAIPAMLGTLTEISGTITAAGTGAPLGDAGVRILESGTRATTALDGIYSLPITAGTWTVRVEAFGYETDETVVVTTSPSPVTHDVALIPIPDTRIDGFVVDELGQGIAGVTVSIPDTPLLPVTTELNGNYAFTRVPSTLGGMIVATATGWAPDARPLALAGQPANILLRLAPAEDFEASNGGLSGTGEWQWGLPNYEAGPEALSGALCWGTDLTGNYNFAFSHTLTTPDYDLSDLVEPRLGFWHWYSIWGPYDGSNVGISTNGGGTWAVIEPIGGYPDPCVDGIPGPGCEPGWNGSSDGWVPVTFDLTSHVGQTARFRFTLGPWGFTDAPGWYIDDLQVYGAGAPTTAVTAAAAAPARSFLGPPAPSPTAGVASITYALATAATIEVRIFDAAGRQVRRLGGGPIAAGTHELRWDGVDDRGREVPAGIYFLRLSAAQDLGNGSRHLTRKLVVVR